MASSQAGDQPDTSAAGIMCSKEGSEMEELRRVQIANEGMNLLLCSRLKEAEDLFRKSRFQGPQMNAGYSFVAFVKAIMSFEDDDIDNAYKLLEATEKFCDPSRGLSGLFSSNDNNFTPHEKLYRRSIVADCLLFEAVLVFLKQGLTSYVKGGYILRKSWKMYERIHAEMEQLCTLPSPVVTSAVSPVDPHVGRSIYDKVDEKVGNGLTEQEVVDGLTDSIGMLSGLGETPEEEEGEVEERKASPSEGEDKDQEDGAMMSRPDSRSSGTCSNDALPEIPRSSVQALEHEDSRLRGAVYFGYGLMNIIVSLIPPKLMKLANLFGFHGTRKVGLQALEFASHSQDMKAPLARLSLLWYHTIVRQFFAMDGEQDDVAVSEAKRLLAEAESLYPDSALFLYFKGKILYLQSDLSQALEAYSYAASLAREQREIEHVCLYEKGWIYYLQMQYSDALPCFMRLKDETRWSASFYAYLGAVTAGVSGDLKQARELFLQCGKLVKRKNNNMEKFCSRRASVYKPDLSPMMDIEMVLMSIELVYLWSALPMTSEATKLKMLEMLHKATSPNGLPFHHGLRDLLMGCVLKSLNRIPEAEKSFQSAAKFEKAIRHDKHIMSFALYELAVIHISRDEFVRARMLLDHAKDNFSSYEFEARLNFKVHSAMGLLR